MEQTAPRPSDLLSQRVVVVLTKAEMLTATIAIPHVFPIGYGWVTSSKTCSAKGRISGEYWSLDCSHSKHGQVFCSPFWSYIQLLLDAASDPPFPSSYMFSTWAQSSRFACWLWTACVCGPQWPLVLNWSAEDGVWILYPSSLFVIFSISISSEASNSVGFWMYREVELGQRCDSGKKMSEIYLLSQLKKKKSPLLYFWLDSLWLVLGP